MTTDVEPVGDSPSGANLSTFPLIVTVFLIFSVGDVFILPRLKQMSPDHPVFAFVAASSFTGVQIGLTAIWLALGWIPLPLRLIIATLSMMLTCFKGPPEVGVSSLFDNCFAVVTAALPCAVARWSGYTIRRRHNIDESVVPKRSWAQFTMGELLAWTTFAALLAGTLRFSVWGRLPTFGQVCMYASIALMHGILLVAMLWATLAEKRNSRAIALAVFISYLWGIHTNSYLHFDPAIMLAVGLGPALSLLGVASVLLLFRDYGFRFGRDLPIDAALSSLAATGFE